MNRIYRMSARVALAGIVALAANCASATEVSVTVAPGAHAPGSTLSRPAPSTLPEAGTAFAGGLFALTGEAAIVVGRTFFTIIGMGIETLPPRAAGPVVPLLPESARPRF